MFMAISQFYDDFPQVSHDEVVSLLDTKRRREVNT
jgi:predicted phosphoribosyltransferase